MQLHSTLSILFLTLATSLSFALNSNESYPLDNVIWSSNNIPVCWENAAVDPAMQAQVRDAVEDTWESNSKLNFTGWRQCTTTFNGIRIDVEDVGPNVVTLGNRLRNRENGMTLNFTYNNWSPSCQSNAVSCTRVIAVHEFGHALGFAHEQNRNDTPDSCNEPINGQKGNVIFTDWDLNSVMNYCNPIWNGDGNLSNVDIMTVQTYYGNVPSYNADTGQIIMPSVNVGSINYRAILDINTKGSFNLSSLSSHTSSSRPANYNSSNRRLTIPFLKVTSNGQVTSLYSAILSYNGSVFTLISATKLQPTPTSASL